MLKSTTLTSRTNSLSCQHEVAVEAPPWGGGNIVLTVPALATAMSMAEMALVHAASGATFHITTSPASITGEGFDVLAIRESMPIGEVLGEPFANALLEGISPLLAIEDVTKVSGTNRYRNGDREMRSAAEPLESH